MLDLARDSTPDEAEASFLALAKVWHPDRLPPELLPLRQACSHVFARLGEARATLTDAEKRARYMRLLVQGSGSPEMQETSPWRSRPPRTSRRPRSVSSRNDFASAEFFCQKALAGDASQPDGFAMLAWLLSLKPESQTSEQTVKSIRMLDKALSMTDDCGRGFYWRGMLYKRIGKVEAAYRDFREAVEFDPGHIDAVREMRLHNMRAGTRSRSSTHHAVSARSSAMPGKPAKQDDKSLFGQFFKKS